MRFLIFKSSRDENYFIVMEKVKSFLLWEQFTILRNWNNRKQTTNKPLKERNVFKYKHMFMTEDFFLKSHNSFIICVTWRKTWKLKLKENKVVC